jgi:hypothetical protein
MRRPRVVALIAAAAVVAGLIAVYEEERASQCELYAAHLLQLDMANVSGTAAQAWDDIYTLNDYGTARDQLRRDMHEAGCPT